MDLSPLSNCGYLSNLYANGNGITDITALSNLSNLTTLNVDNNEITTLEPLNNLQKLDSVYVNNNKLTNLNGLEYSLSLNKLYAAQNQITDINGITNCTLLEEFNINDNEVEDISLLKKSAATLKKVYFNGNKVSDISALKGMAELQYLSFDNNEVTEIDVLKEYVSLYSISAENNEIKDIDALADIDTLEYVFLANNTIENMEALSQKEKKYFVIDLSNNNISDLTLSEGMEISCFSIYNNPISSIDGAKKIKGNNFLISYKDGMNFDGFKGKFTYFNIMDCPLDKQLPVKMEITGSEYGFGITYCTVEEAEQIIARTKHETITGTIPQNTTVEDDEMVEVPLVIGCTFDEAKEKLNELGLGIYEVADYSGAYETGIIFKQSIEVGERVTPNTTIIVTVSKYSMTFELPSLIGKTQSEAEEFLKNKHLKISYIYEEIEDEKLWGTVKSSNPSAGTSVKSADEITLTIYTGQNVINAKVPDVEGMTLEEAKATLEKAGFTNYICEYEYNDKVEKGNVITQKGVEIDNEVSVITQITLVVSIGK